MQSPISSFQSPTQQEPSSPTEIDLHQVKTSTNEQLLRELSHRKTIRLEEKERDERIGEILEIERESQIDRLNDLEKSIRMEEEERCRRIQEDLKLLAQSQFLRKQSGLLADDLSEKERLRRERSESYKNIAQASKPIKEKIEKEFLDFVQQHRHS